MTFPKLNPDLQAVAVWFLGIGYLLNAGFMTMITLFQDGHSNPAIVQSLTDNQHYVVAALAGIASVHIVANLLSGRQAPKSPAATGEASNGG